MSRLFLHCELCSRKQADGLLSRGFWGHLDVANGHTLRACGDCKSSNADWEDRLRATLTAPMSTIDQSGFGLRHQTAG